MEKFRFKKKFGQNFLKNTNLVQKIVDIAEIKKEDLVIEVGPGKAIMIKKLSLVAGQVLSYEIDSELIPDLDEVASSYPNICFIYDDFLKRNIAKDISSYSYDKLYFVSNVPYYITTPILMKLIQSHLSFEKIVMMVQKEVGERFCASFGSKSYGSISVFLNYYYHVKKEFLVSRENFIPVPNVDSVIISLTKRERKLPLIDEVYFQKLVRDSFQFKRKTIRNNLREYNLEKIEKVLEKNGYHLSSRAEELPIDVFIEMSNALS